MAIRRMAFFVEAFTGMPVINAFLYTPSVHKKEPNHISLISQAEYLYLVGTNHSILIWEKPFFCLDKTKDLKIIFCWDRGSRK